MTARAAQRTATVSFSGVDGLPVRCLPGESILLAGLRAGLPLTYECASGGCGSCRAQLLDGDVASRWEEATGLSARDRRRGDRILMCQSVPLGDCAVHVGQASSTGGVGPVPTPNRHAATLAAREMLTRDTALVSVRLEAPMTYRSGQFVVLEFGGNVRRAYSMSRPGSGPTTHLELLVRAKPGGAASTLLFRENGVGDDLVVEGPYGQAHAQSPADRPVVCLAGGTGLAPVLAISEHLVEQNADRPLDVYVGARQVGDVVLADRLRYLADRGARVHVVVEQRPGTDHPDLGVLAAGLAVDVLADAHPDLSGHDVYVAGPPGMVDACIRRIVRRGSARADRVFFDRFID